MRLEQLWPRYAHQQERRVLRSLGEALEDVEDGRLGPLEIVDDHDGRLACDRGKVLTHRPRELARDVLRADLGKHVLHLPQPEHRRKPLPDRDRVGAVQLGRALVELRQRRVSIVVRGDARVLADDLHYGPIGDAGPVRKNSAAEHPRVSARRDPRQQLAHETRFPDPSVPDEREEMSTALRAYALERLKQQSQFALPPDELRAHCGKAPRLRRDRSSRTHGAKCTDRLRLALGCD